MKASTAQRITSGPIDPDLEAVLPGLARAAHRLRQLDSMIADHTQSYGSSVARKTERSEIAKTFSTTAERLKISGDTPGRALLAIVEKADDLYRARRRRPSLAQVLQSLADAVPAAERDRDSADAEAKMTAGVAREAARHVSALTGARQYLEACRG